MKHHMMSRYELLQAQLALLAAIALQIFTRHLGSELFPGSQYLIIVAEIVLVVLIGFTVNTTNSRFHDVHHALAVLFLGIISIANISGLVYVLHSLINGTGILHGEQLLAAALAILMTNIIVYALWYWEIDSPGLTRTHWSIHEQDFQFTQQDLDKKFPNWQPQFGDYLYLAICNAINFAPADARPLTLQAKALMASQSIVSVSTLALVLARSVSILGT